MFIFHITTPELWNDALNKGVYNHPTLKSEGFIHCSFQHQLEGVAGRYFAEADELLVLHISDNKLKEILKVEQLGSATEPYPHLYGKIPLTSIINVAIAPRKEGGGFEWWWE